MVLLYDLIIRNRKICDKIYFRVRGRLSLANVPLILTLLCFPIRHINEMICKLFPDLVALVIHVAYEQTYGRPQFER